MMGYRIVFDRESLKLAWSRSNCEFSCLSIFFKECSIILKLNVACEWNPLSNVLKQGVLFRGNLKFLCVLCFFAFLELYSMEFLLKFCCLLLLIRMYLGVFLFYTCCLLRLCLFHLMIN